MTRLSAYKIAVIYALFSFLWILFSDYMLEQLVHDPRLARQLQTFKGWIFVLITAGLLHMLIKRYASELVGYAKRLQKSEQRYRRVFENAGAGTVLLEKDLTILLVNSSFEKFSGYSMEEIEGRISLINFVTPKDREKLLSYRDQMLQRPDIPPGEVECGLIDRYGMQKDTLLKITRMPGTHDIIASFIDITSLKKTQHRLQESEQRFRAAFDYAPIGMGLLSASGIYYKVNQALCTMLGYSAGELGSRTWIEFTHPEDLQISEEQLSRLESENRITQIEKRYIRKDGSTLWALVSASRISDPEGKTQYYLIQIVDITKRKQAMEEMQESENRYRKLFDYAGDPIFVQDFDLNILDINQVACTRLGYTREEILRMRMSDICCRSDEILIADRISKLKATGHLVFETEYMLKSGEKIPVEASISEIDFIHRPAILMIARDIGERKQSENLRMQLQQAQKMQAIGTLAGGIAHDFNNILFPIIGYTEMALYDIPETSKAREYLIQVLEATSRAKDLVQQILTFSRRRGEELKPVKLQPIVKETLRLCRSTFPSTIEIRKHIDPNCGPVMGDPTQIHQVVMNLCMNAYQSIPDARGILDVKLDEVILSEEDKIPRLNLPPGRYVHLSVSDTGRGIAPTDIEKIFEPYFTTKTPGEGTGLGLAVTLGIVKSLKGDITVFSTIGEGSSFHVYLPVIEMEHADDQQIPEKFIPPKGRERVLIVDDEIQLLQMEQLMLTHLGYDVTSYSNSMEALEAFQKNPDQFDLLITDQTMPMMTGIELAKNMIAIRPGLPVILCSGYSRSVTEEKIKATGIRRYLLKPVPMHELATEIRQTLDAGP